MAYGIASREEVKRERARIAAARQAEERIQLFKDWAGARAEAHACGKQFPSFSEWLGESNSKAEAVDRYMNDSDDYGYVD